MTKTVRLGEFLGEGSEEKFEEFDLTEIQEILSQLKESSAIDLSHAEMLQQKTLRGADIILDYLAKITKTVGYLEAEIYSVKNKASLEYEAPTGKTTTDMKIWAGGASPEVKEISRHLSRAKASKLYLEKKYDILIRTHHHYKDMAMGLRKSILGYNPVNTTKNPEDWE